MERLAAGRCRALSRADDRRGPNRASTGAAVTVPHWRRRGPELRAAINAIKNAANETGATRLFSLRQEFPSEWHRLTEGNVPVHSSQEFAFTKDRFPFLFGSNRITISKVDLYAAPRANSTLATFPELTLVSPQGAAPLGTSTPVGRLQRVSTQALSVPVVNAPADSKWTVNIPSTQLAAFQKDVGDILAVCHYIVG